MIEWFISSAALLAIMIALHYFLRERVSARLQYALWALVLVRLLLPVSVGKSAVSVENLVPETRHTVLYTRDQNAAAANSVAANAAANVAAESKATEPPAAQSGSPAAVRAAQSGSPAASAQSAPPEQRSTALRPEKVVLWVWMTGAAVVLVWFAVCNLTYGRTLRCGATRLEAETTGWPPVYLSPRASSPCLFGVFRPVIYLTPESAADPTTRSHCIAHEQTHYRHGDQIWALLRGVCLALHWFNPLAWWAAKLARTDAELWCDEDAIRRLGEQSRAAYGRTLIRMTCGTRINPLCTATTMSGKGSELKARIRSIAKHPKTAVPVLIAVLLLAALAAGCTMTSGTQKPDSSESTRSEPEQIILDRINGSSSGEQPTSRAANALTAYLAAHYDQLDARGFFADDAEWELSTANRHDFALVIRDAEGNTLDVISYTEEYDIANDAAYRCAMALASADVDPAVVAYVNETDVMPDAQFARYLTQHGEELQDSGIWDYDTIWSLRKHDNQIDLAVANLPDGSMQVFTMDCDTLTVQAAAAGTAIDPEVLARKLDGALTAEIVRDDTDWAPLRELDEEKQQAALTAYTGWLTDNGGALLAAGALGDDVHWELLGAANGDAKLRMQSGNTRNPAFYDVLYYDAETGHVDDFDVRLMNALSQSNIQDLELTQTVQAAFGAYFRDHYETIAPLGIFRYGSRWTVRLTDGDVFLDAEKSSGEPEQFILTPADGLIHRSGAAADAPGAYETVWTDFALNWRLDYLPVFSEAEYPENNGVPDAASEYLMWVYVTNRDAVDAAGGMDAAWVQDVIETHFHVRRLSMDDLPKTWVLRGGRYEPIPAGVNPKPLIRLDALATDTSGSRTVFTVKYTFFSARHEIANDAEWQQLRANILAGDLSGLWEDHIDTVEFYFENGRPVFLSHKQLFVCAAYNPNTPLQDDEVTLPHGVRFGMTYEQAHKLCAAYAENEESGDEWRSFDCEGYHYTFNADDVLISASIRSAADGGNVDPVTPIFRDIRLGDTMESVFDKFPCTDRELKQWVSQIVYGDPDSGEYAELQFVAYSFYMLGLHTTGGYHAAIVFSRNDSTVKWIDLYGPDAA